MTETELLTILIQNGTIVTALDTYVGDVRTEGGTIVAIGSGFTAEPGDTVIDASGQYVFPGGIDPHVHMELPFMGTVSADDFETGTAAGVATRVTHRAQRRRGRWALTTAARRAPGRPTETTPPGPTSIHCTYVNSACDGSRWPNAAASAASTRR